MGEFLCPKCGNEYKELGTHWQHNPSHRPDLTNKQYDVAVGLLMGDGTMNRSSKNASIMCAMVSPNYLRYVDDIFGCLGICVELWKTAAENARDKRNSGFRPNAKCENYSDLYRWRSRTHPEFNEFSSWYSDDGKVWPTDINLTPTVLKHWYCGDGHWDNSGSANRIEFSVSNEVNNTEKISEIFERSGLPSPSNYVVSDRDGGRVDCVAQFTVKQSHELWHYMGEPLPDFEYKWPKEYR
jgi:hypothetical protein